MFTKPKFPILSVLVLLLAANAFGAAGDVDTSFTASLVSKSSNVRKTLVQSDGKILASGSFRVANGMALTSIARFNADGTLDTSFNPPDYFYLNGAIPTIYDFEFQSDGKIIVVGDFFGVNGVLRYRMLRLNSDGSLDSTFAFVGSATINEVVVYADDRIVSGGLVALTPDGATDNSKNFPPFSGFVTSLLLQPDGKLLASFSGNEHTVKRFNLDGSQDSTFTSLNFNNVVLELERQTDGKILVGGAFGSVNGFAFSRMARLNQDGTIDGTFSTNNDPGNAGVSGIAVAANGKIAVSGNFTFYQGIARNRIALLNSDGTLDLSFDYTGGAFPVINDVAFQTDGKLLFGGSTLFAESSLVRLNIDGSTDTSFQARVVHNGAGHKVLIQPDGKIVVGGAFALANGTPRVNLVRFNADGSLDSSFNAPSVSPIPLIYGLDLQSDGKILVVGDSNGTSVFRLNTDGSLDFTFPLTGIARDVKVLPNGKILIATSGQIRRFNSDGSADMTFATIAGTVYKMFLQPDGKVLIGGSFSQVNSVNRGNFARLNADGTLDTSFNPSGGANGAVNDIASQTNGKVIVGGDFTGINFDLNRKYLARLNSDGTLDNTFTPTVNAAINVLTIQSNGKILVGGALNFVNVNSRSGVVRLNPNGVFDGTFNSGIGSNGVVWDIELQSDGKIVFCGNISQTNGLPTIGVGRLLNAVSLPNTPFDFDGDGRADVSVFRPSTSRWYEFQSSNSQVAETTFGIVGDVVVPADYDGDGKTDEAIFRPSTGDWWYQSSINDAQVSLHWGASGDIPRPSDFDGDGKADFIVYRPSNSVWYRYGTTGQVSVAAFGIAEDKPLVGDFDGDGKSDLAIFRPSTGDWWYAASSVAGQFRATHWGVSTDIPVPADYDGDGKTDFAVYRPSEGGWYILNSGNGSFTTSSFGLAEDRPVAADYDGDGRADIAVFRPSTGVWYLLQTTSGFGALQFGISTDIPTENAFLQ